MSVTVGVNNRTVVHKDSSGIATNFPDVCLTQSGPATVPIPYPNIAQSSDIDKTAIKVKADGNGIGHEKSVFGTSSGDEAGTSKGIMSGKMKGKADFLSFSFDVKVEGKGVVRAFDTMLNNDKNTPPIPLLQPPLIANVLEEPEEDPEFGKIKIVIFDPFGEPMSGVKFETEFDGVKENKKTLKNGALIYNGEKEKIKFSIKHEKLGLKEIKEKK